MWTFLVSLCGTAVWEGAIWSALSPARNERGEDERAGGRRAVVNDGGRGSVTGTHRYGRCDPQCTLVGGVGGTTAAIAFRGADGHIRETEQRGHPKNQHVTGARLTADDETLHIEPSRHAGENSRWVDLIP